MASYSMAERRLCHACHAALRLRLAKIGIENKKAGGKGEQYHGMA